MDNTYEVNARREGRFWMVEIPAFDGLTQAESREGVETSAREWLALHLGHPQEAISVSVRDS